MREIHFNRGQLFAENSSGKKLSASRRFTPPVFLLLLPLRFAASLCIKCCVFFSQLLIFIVSQHLFGFDIHLMHFVDAAGFLLLSLLLLFSTRSISRMHTLFHTGPSSIYFRYSFIFKCVRLHVRSFIYLYILFVCESHFG